MPDYVRDKARSIDFLQNYHCPIAGGVKYEKQLVEIANRKRKVLEVELDDLETYLDSVRDDAEEEDDFMANIEKNTRRYHKIFSKAVDDILPAPTDASLPSDIFDVLATQRANLSQRRREDAATQEGDLPEEDQNGPPLLPAELLRRYEVVIRPRSKAPAIKLREVSARHVGQLVTVKGIVTQVTDVKPLMTVATYLDDATGYEVYQEVIGKEFTPLQTAPDPGAASSARAILHLQTRGSKFVRFQEARMQELASEVPQGATPRMMTVHLLGELTRSLKPGNAVSVAGIFLPQPYTGFKAMRAGLLTSTYLQAQVVTQLKASYHEAAQDKSVGQQIEALLHSDGLLRRLAGSLAPEIFGHDDVKIALLLLMVGGSTRTLPDGMKLRGDIHMCLMGDPGVAKSQLIKHIVSISPRAVYTTGKGSSGVGLTAAVQKDAVTGEMVLEGGALVLADKGICCIDEFDKMEEGDRTAIHEVMEQQTVSIAKAGITTTLNTRTTVLAAANPAWGRYDTRRSPAENIALPAALLSRFDLMWLIIDKHDPDQDRALAEHVLRVHSEGKAPSRSDDGRELLPPEVLRGYIARAKEVHPFVPEELAGYIAEVYADMRAVEQAEKQPHSYTTARTLLSILRIAQALARLRFSTHVEKEDIDEAHRLMRSSKKSLFEACENQQTQIDPLSAIYSSLRDDSQARGKRTYVWAELLAMFQRRFTVEQIRETVAAYEEACVFTVDWPTLEEPTIHFADSDFQDGI